jgi:hypothetical protein
VRQKGEKDLMQVSKKVLGLFEGEFTLKVLNSSEKKKAIQKKVKDFISNQVLKEPVAREMNPEKLRIAEDLDQIPFIPTVHLTEDCLKNFFITIASLNEKYKHIGLVKLRLPPGHKPERLSFTPENQKIEVRQQVLPFLPLGKVSQSWSNS